MIDCTECDGTGIQVGFDTIICSQCKGFGVCRDINPYEGYYDGVEGLEGYYE